MTEEIKNLLKNLSRKERDVIVLLFGLDGYPKSPDEIAAQYAIKEDYVVQLAEQALPKIPATTEELRAIAEKAHEEFKSKMAERKSRRLLSDADSELLNKNFFEKSSDNQEVSNKINQEMLAEIEKILDKKQNG